MSICVPGDLLVAFTDGVTEARNARRRGVRGREAEGSPARRGWRRRPRTSASTLADRIREWIAGSRAA